LSKKAFEAAKAQALDILHQRARDEDPIYYKQLSEKITAMPIPAKSPEMDRLLDEISKAEARADRGMLSAVVIRQAEQIPGEGFFKLARELGKPNVEPHDAFWLRELKRVYEEHRRPGAS
jgi:hypothetical protein